MMQRLVQSRLIWVLGAAAILTGTLVWAVSESLAAEKAKKGWLGVSVQELTPSLKQAYRIGSQSGLLVTDVVEDSPADDAGMREEDVIIQFDGKNVEKSDDFSRLVRQTEPEKKVKVVVLRDGERKELEVTLGKRRTQPAHAYAYGFGEAPAMHFAGARPRLGVQVHELNDDLARYFKVEAGSGVLVLEVNEDSPADEAGIKAGDVITKVDETAVRDTEDLIETLADYEEGDKVSVELVRSGKNEKVEVELESAGEVGWQHIAPRIERFKMKPFKGDRWHDDAILFEEPLELEFHERAFDDVQRKLKKADLMKLQLLKKSGRLETI